MASKAVLWYGDEPCSECGCKLHSQYETSARAYVCAGCFNELAEDCGWVTPVSEEEQDARDRDNLQENTPDYRGLGSID